MAKSRPKRARPSCTIRLPVRVEPLSGTRPAGQVRPVWRKSKWKTRSRSPSPSTSATWPRGRPPSWGVDLARSADVDAGMVHGRGVEAGPREDRHGDHFGTPRAPAAGKVHVEVHEDRRRHVEQAFDRPLAGHRQRIARPHLDALQRQVAFRLELRGRRRLEVVQEVGIEGVIIIYVEDRLADEPQLGPDRILAASGGRSRRLRVSCPRWSPPGRTARWLPRA